MTHFVENRICQLGGIQIEISRKTALKNDIYKKLKTVCSTVEENRNKLYREWEKIFILQSHLSALKKKDNRPHSQNDEFEEPEIKPYPTNASETVSIKTFRIYSEQNKIFMFMIHIHDSYFSC